MKRVILLGIISFLAVFILTSNIEAQAMGAWKECKEKKPVVFEKEVPLEEGMEELEKEVPTEKELEERAKAEEKKKRRKSITEEVREKFKDKELTE